jgi:S-formylglutathione hydrolase FrmB
MDLSTPLSDRPDLAGSLDRTVIESELLKGNPLGDDHRRALWVYTPPGYHDTDAHYPAVYVIQGYTGQVTMWANRTPYRKSFIETTDEVFAAGAPGCVVVFVDAWTRYGGSQFVDSPGTGRYMSYICDEVVPFVDARYRTIADRESRAISGKSSGGFGAMIMSMLRPDVFGAFTTHAGDSLYELCYLREFGPIARALRECGGDIMAWWADFQTRPSLSKPEDMVLLPMLGCAAAFSANPDGSIELPLEPSTGRVRDDIWQRWLDWDPVRMAPRHADALRSARAIWIDAGTRDDFYLDLGATAFHDELRKLGVDESRVHFELFPAGHGGIDYRYPLALEWMARRLAR